MPSNGKNAAGRNSGEANEIGLRMLLSGEEQPAEESSNFGKIEDQRLNRERNSAIMEFDRVDSAAAVMKDMDGKDIGGGKPKPRVSSGNSRRSSSVWDGDQVSRKLWIHHLRSVRVDENMLYNAMILYGEIDRVKLFPMRGTAFVEFRKMEEARRAKEGLMGRLFNDPRIQIQYSNDERFPFGRAYTNMGTPLKRHVASSDSRGREVSLNGKEAKRRRRDDSPLDEGSLPRRRVEGPARREPFNGSEPQPRPVPGSLFGGKSLSRDYCWRGVIAKGGTALCLARCVPLGKGIGSPLPETLNCSARTGLDMLSKHYQYADGFDMVFFLPEREENFPSYTEFIRYLRLNNRAGVAKLEDGATLFIIPHSDFLTRVLQVNGPLRLYGVIFKIPQQIAAVENQQTLNVLPRVGYERSPLSTSHPLTSPPEPIEVSRAPALMAEVMQGKPRGAAPLAGSPVRPYVNEGQQPGTLSGTPALQQNIPHSSVEKNKSHLSTLQLAANLLLQLKHQQ